MVKNKLKKFAQNAEYNHVIQPAQTDVIRADHALKGRWHETFGNDHPLVLELACGKGEYTTGQAAIYPDRNFIGIDIKGARIYSGAKLCLEQGLYNVRFLRTRIDLITRFFGPSEVDGIWITFADPQMEKPRKRLTSTLFLQRYVQLLKAGAVLHLKTDSDDLYQFTRDESIPGYNASQHEFRFVNIFDTSDLYGSGINMLDETMQKVLNIRTYYESRWLDMGKKIKYLQYRLDRIH